MEIDKNGWCARDRGVSRMKSIIINFGNTEKVLLDVEDVFKKHKLNLDEKILIVKYLNDRAILQKQQVDGQKLVDSMSPLGIIKKVIGGKYGQEEKE